MALPVNFANVNEHSLDPESIIQDEKVAFTNGSVQLSLVVCIVASAKF